MASIKNTAQKAQSVSIVNKNLPSFGTDKQLEASIGKQVRISRKNAGVTLQQLSKQSLLSASMLSKIENGQISASLKTIQLICHALNISITSLFKQHDKDVEPTFIKSGNGLTIERAGSDESRHYQLLGHNVSGSLKVEPCLITVTSRDYDFPDFQHKGVEFIYMLKGEMDYYYGTEIYHFQKGDSIYFDSDKPHGPKKIISDECQFLTVICSNNSD
ncbi:XRE family transcriptional regulator [Candidatus Thioglobus sp.]|mgnify:FL=1|jgi:transcriptional regulator with XRE-family HTH domain|uniref:helix-turn-helix domain-containing protein n=1 Tax=Candidatus Pseudothioglobus sp. Uisw_016 TaxID=3230995 RepID=UPI0023278C20|nr:XRE family transcriptional regulator [Candidatus Thioglobus sp.]MDA9319600.1 XRE family transcriptional regulator [Candidatus Thioglobus sp.]MDC1536081.1 XRE family transcriptional regulator [Candidatus Thioglobus sp.]